MQPILSLSYLYYSKNIFSLDDCPWGRATALFIECLILLNAFVEMRLIMKNHLGEIFCPNEEFLSPLERQ